MLRLFGLFVAVAPFSSFVSAENVETNEKDKFIERITITSTPIKHAVESAQPISVLSDEHLQDNHSLSLGETLKSQLGIHSSYFGPVSASPIIRGLDGPRILIAQNGLDASDASRVGADHLVSTETATAQQIEILRGPASLLFGNGAIGGVVNVVDQNIQFDHSLQADWFVQHHSALTSNEWGLNSSGGQGNWGWSVSVNQRQNDDIIIPHAIEAEEEHEEHDDHDGHDEHEGHEHHHRLKNSASEADSVTFSGGYQYDQGQVVVTLSQLNRLYGVPGHHHHEEEDHDHDAEEHLEHEESVQGDMEQSRSRIEWQHNFDNHWLKSLNNRFAYTDYQHAEVEGHEVHSEFSNTSWQNKTDLVLMPNDNWQMAITADIKQSKFSAIGEEAITPSSTSNSYALALLAETQQAGLIWQFGSRIEKVNLDADNMTNTAIGFASNGLPHTPTLQFPTSNLEFKSTSATPISASLGVIWQQQQHQWSASYAQSQRMPSASELYAFGPHLGSQTFEVGYGYQLSGTQLTYQDQLVLEEGHNLELSYWYESGPIQLQINGYINKVNNFYYQQKTDLLMLAEPHWPVYQTVTDDATIWGNEAQVTWQAADNWQVQLSGDTVFVELDTAGNLPRVPPARLKLNVEYQGDHSSHQLQLSQHLDQTKVANNEEPTDGYLMVNFKNKAHFELGNHHLTAILDFTNILNVEAQVHSSYIKDQTMLPGFGVNLAVRGYW